MNTLVELGRLSFIQFQHNMRDAFYFAFALFPVVFLGALVLWVVYELICWLTKR